MNIFLEAAVDALRLAAASGLFTAAMFLALVAMLFILALETPATARRIVPVAMWVSAGMILIGAVLAAL